MRPVRPAWLIAAALWVVVCAVGFLMPEPWIPDALVEDFDDMAHMAAFAGVVALAGVALPRWVWPVAVVAVALALASEWAQATFTTDRGAQWSDVGADVVGICIGLAIALRVRAEARYTNRRRVASTGRR